MLCNPMAGVPMFAPLVYRALRLTEGPAISNIQVITEDEHRAF